MTGACVIIYTQCTVQEGPRGLKLNRNINRATVIEID